MNRNNLIKTLKTLGKHLRQNLNYGNIKRGLETSKNIIEGIDHLRGNPLIGERVKKLTDNDTYNKIKSGVDVVDTIDKTFNRTKELKPENILPHSKAKYDRLNREGIANARREHFKIRPVRSLIGRNRTEDQMAEDIIHNMRN